MAATVLYPRQSDTTFDMNYYLKTHIPIIQKNWKPFGLEKWEVIDFRSSNVTTEASPYVVAAIFFFESAADQQAAVKSAGTAEILGDVPKFTNAMPTLSLGTLAGSG